MNMDKAKLKQIKDDTDGLRNVNNLNDITPAMVHKHVHAEQSFREHLSEVIDNHVIDSTKFWTENAKHLSTLQETMDKKIDKIFDKLESTSGMTKEALQLARSVNDSITPLLDKISNHESRLDNHDLERAKIQGGFKVAMWIMGIFGIVASSFYYLYIQNIKNEIKKEIRDEYQGASVQAIEERPNSGIYKINVITK